MSLDNGVRLSLMWLRLRVLKTRPRATNAPPYRADKLFGY